MEAAVIDGSRDRRVQMTMSLVKTDSQEDSFIEKAHLNGVRYLNIFGGGGGGE